MSYQANPARPLTLTHRALLIGAVVVVYSTGFAPNDALLGAGMRWLGNPAYEGFRGMFLPHLLLYSTLMAAVAAALWGALVAARLLPAPQLGSTSPRALALGAVGGLAALAGLLALVELTMPDGVRWIGLDPWKVAGNLFSNFYEEFVYRGFVLVALSAVFGFWPAALVASAMWALTHQQYPLPFQLLIFLSGVGWSWIARATRGLLAPYLSHTILDTAGDSLVG
ncbi:CPBP family intramembrane glutamic endopeptidase [Sphingomonas mesophila]|uniref:CPBP family intramembrane glutamic endopeptidase n=1 Tax=Sphingomonas mesophila TaxID=2303576 RepID=UPI000E57B86E|nr:CPBP family intramembrane glutamic endopeptidase [Sphingomonas mesophila]